MAATTHHSSETTQAVAGGLTVFAAVMLIVAGILAVLRGVMGIVKDDIFVSTPNYIFKFDVTGWGWIHLVLGIVAIVVGASLFQAATWARFTGVLIAVLLMVSSFLSLPYYPLWSIVLIALYGFIIWALCVVKKEPI